MELNKYKSIIEETAIFPNTVSGFGKAYCMLGLVGEFQEYLNAIQFSDKVKEVGDVIWYITALSRELGVDIEKVYPEMVDVDETVYMPDEAAIEEVHSLIALLSEMIKKHYRDNKAIDVDSSEDIIHKLMFAIYAIILNNQLHISRVLEVNYNKLMKRKKVGKLQGSGDNREEQ